MRKAISCILVMAILLLAIPVSALASEGAKHQFIENYLHIMDETLDMVNVYTEDMKKNTIQLNFDGELAESTYQEADGTKLINVPCNGSLEIIGNQKNGQCQLNFSGQVLEYLLNGTVYISEDGFIIPKQTIEAFSELDTAGLVDMDLEDLPSYVVFQPDLSEEDRALIQEAFTSNMDMYSKKRELTAFYRELLSTIPASYFFFKDGYAILDIQPSIIGSAIFINNLKNNSQNLAEKFTAIMTQPSYLSDEEFAAMKAEMEAGIVEGIDAIQITDLAELELPFTVDEFKFSTKYDSILTSIHISGNLEGDVFDLAINASSHLTEGENNSEINLDLLVDSPDIFIDIVIAGQGKDGPHSGALGLVISGDIRTGEELMSGEIRMKTALDFDSESRISIPEINENNSMVIDMADFIPPQEEWINKIPTEWDDESLKVFVYGQKLNFEAEPLIINSCTMVPVREISEHLYCDVSWQAPDTVIFSDEYSGVDLTMKVNSTTYYLGDQVLTMDNAPVIINGHTYVPIKVVADYLGYTLEWDAASRSVLMDFDY